MKNIFNKKPWGFSLVELSVALGMMGILTTVILNLTEQQVSLQKKSEIGSELAYFHSRLVLFFNDKRSCENTLNRGLASPPLRTVSDDMIIDDIKDASNNNVVTANATEFGTVISGTAIRPFKVSSIRLVWGAIVPDPADPTPPNVLATSANLNIVYEVAPELTSYQGNRLKTRSIPLGDLKLRQNGANFQLRSCIGNTAFVSVDPRQICDSISGVHDISIPSANRCRLSNFFDYDTGGTQQICSNADATYCVTAWSITNFNDRRGISTRSLMDYNNRVYGTGTAPNTSNLFLGNKAGEFVTSTASGNTFIGVMAGRFNTATSSNIMIGNRVSISPNTRITSIGNGQLNIGNVLIGRMPTDTTGSPSLNYFGTDSGLVVNGRMNVTDHIKIGTSATLACNAANVGTLRVNGSNLQYCNGTAWGSLLPPPGAIYIWVPNINTDGSISHTAAGVTTTGVDAAHKICADESSSANLPNTFSYTHKAILGTTTNNPKNYLTGAAATAREIHRPNGTFANGIKISNHWRRLWNASNPLDAPIVASYSKDAWTGLNDNGNVQTSRNCNNWTSTSSWAFRGFPDAGRANTFQAGGKNCNVSNNMSFYCVSY